MAGFQYRSNKWAVIDDFVLCRIEARVGSLIKTMSFPKRSQKWLNFATKVMGLEFSEGFFFF